MSFLFFVGDRRGLTAMSCALIAMATVLCLAVIATFAFKTEGVACGKCVHKCSLIQLVAAWHSISCHIMSRHVI